jgi:hypothetical protein
LVLTLLLAKTPSPKGSTERAALAVLSVLRQPFPTGYPSDGGQLPTVDSRRLGNRSIRRPSISDASRRTPPKFVGQPDKLLGKFPADRGVIEQLAPTHVGVS